MKIGPAWQPPVKSDGPVLSRTMMQKELARQAAKEAGMARYIPLDCGHSTTLEVQQLYDHWRPKKGLAMCEACNGEWVQITRPRASRPIPQTPLF